ncbi:MAG: SWIM zinc finger family protein, partial [Bryobacterales bacterium]|nr:SWIM zinc finger family protein [Bryobacterales bacterium]
MSLAAKLAFQVDKSTQVRGYQIHANGAVKIEETTANGVEATVRGSSQPYEVSVLEENGLVGVYCECPAFAKFGPCKHIWATLLVIDEKRLLQGAGDAPKLSITHLNNLDDSLDDDDDEEEEEEEEDPFVFDLPRIDRSRGNPNPPPRPAQNSPPRPLWREQLYSVLEDSRHRLANELHSTWASGLELAYVICRNDSRRNNAVVMTL